MLLFTLKEKADQMVSCFLVKQFVINKYSNNPSNILKNFLKQLIREYQIFHLTPHDNMIKHATQQCFTELLKYKSKDSEKHN